MASVDLLRDLAIPTRDEEPAYRGLARVIQERIHAGQLRPGDQLPTQRAIARSLNLSMHTVQHAYNLLIREGVLVGGHGKRATVADRRREMPRRDPDLVPGRRKDQVQHLVGKIRDVESTREGIRVSLQLVEGQLLKLTTSQAAMAWLNLGPGQTATISLEELGIHLTRPVANDEP
ncbi:MAG: hypothetical protein QOF51_502 [Chloroflexota bacterium]|jgi:GntR family transcriptional regulator/MocR family aminotransferase|nr:hypothetical protein [Chloroflexota bacterium]